MRLAIAESVYSKSHDGEGLDQNRKLVTAKCLENLNRFMNEAFENSVGTQRQDMGMFKKFALNLTTVALPNLIANDLVIVHPMTSMSGYVTYIEYQFASNKGDVKQGDLISNPWGFGDAHEAYTASRVVETVGAGVTEITVSWTPVVTGVFYDKDTDTHYDAKITHTDGTVAFANVVDGKVTGVVEGDRVAYAYDNVVIPQNDLPMVKAEMKSVALVAKARRIAIYYSQIAAYQAKTDYGVDLGDQLAEKAVGELSYKKFVA